MILVLESHHFFRIWYQDLYQAGVAGTKKRSELEQNCEPFDGKPEEDENTIVNSARSTVEAKVQIDFFTTMVPG